MAEPRKLSPEEFRTIQLLEPDMLEELDRVCRKYDIKYCITYSSRKTAATCSCIKF